MRPLSSVQITREKLPSRRMSFASFAHTLSSRGTSYGLLTRESASEMTCSSRRCRWHFCRRTGFVRASCRTVPAYIYIWLVYGVR